MIYRSASRTSLFKSLFLVAALFLGPNQGAGASESGKSLAGPKPQSIDTITEAYNLFETGDAVGALDAFDRAIEEDASSLSALLGRAMVFATVQDHEKAFFAYDDVIQTHPANSFAWNGRGLAAFNLENFDEALSSFKEATADEPINGFFYESLAWTHMCLGEFGEAIENAKKATLMYNQKRESAVYPLLIAYFSYLEEGQKNEAIRTLKYALKNKPAKNTWPYPVFDFLAQRIEANELLSFVMDSTEETEAHTYIGLELLNSGDAQRANDHFDWVAAKGDERVFEYTLARAMLTQNRATASLDQRSF